MALAQKITERRVKQLWAEYRKTNKIPVLNKTGRKQKPISEEHQKIIDKTYKEYCVGPLALEKVIQRKYKIHIPHNTIYRHMLKKDLVIENSKRRNRENG